MAGKPRSDSIARTFDSHWKLNEATGCHEWQRAKHKAGYGNMYANGRYIEAHRFAWERANGIICDERHVCHKCDNPSCVNVSHMFLGTNTDNRRDSKAKRRHAFGKRHGHAKLTPEQVRDLRRAWTAGEGSQNSLALRFGISQTQVWRIVNGARWTA